MIGHHDDAYCDLETPMWKISSVSDGADLGRFDWVISGDRSIASWLLEYPTEQSIPSLQSLREGFARPIKTHFVPVASLVLMISFRQPISSEVFPYDSLQISFAEDVSPADRIISWVSKDSSKPGRPEQGPQNFVLQSTVEFAQAVLM